MVCQSPPTHTTYTRYVVCKPHSRLTVVISVRSVSLAEDTALNSAVVSVVATDADDPSTNDNGAIRFSIESKSVSPALS